VNSSFAGQEEYQILKSQCDELAKEKGIHLVFLIYNTGQIIATSGRTEGKDLTGLAALFAGSMAGATGIAKIFNESVFSTVIYEGPKEHVLMSAIAKAGILIIHFDRLCVSGRVRFLIKKRMCILAAQLEMLKVKYAQLKSPMLDVSEEEIDDFNFGGF
jgi:predicted regulator of Ras-like GTPase activity (Roadblock/LC7/MglB family)